MEKRNHMTLLCFKYHLGSSPNLVKCYRDSFPRAMPTNSWKYRFPGIRFSQGHWGNRMWASVYKRWRTYNPYLIALAIYGSSRLVVVLAIYISARYVLPSHPKGSV